MKNPLPYYGGKDNYWPWILGFFPPHTTYVEPFGGAASCLLNKPPSPVEVYNDVMGDLVNFFRVLRDRPDELIAKLRLTPYARQEFVEAIQALNDGSNLDELERARMFFVTVRQSVGGGGQIMADGRWSYCITESNRKMSKTVSAWLSSHDRLLVVAERLKEVQIECLDALDVIQRYDTPDTLFYNDPPYVPDVADSSYYLHRYTIEDHRQLSDILHQVQGKAILSGYPSDLYEELYPDWHRECMSALAVANVAKGDGSRDGQKRTECLWFNFRPRGQLRLF